MSQEKTYEIAPETVAGVAAGVAVGAAIKAVNELLCGQSGKTIEISENELRELSDGIAKKVISLLEGKGDIVGEAGGAEAAQAVSSGIMSELFDVPFDADRLNTRTRRVFDSIPPNSVGDILNLGADGLRQFDGVGAKTAAEIFGIAAAQENEFSLPIEEGEIEEELPEDLIAPELEPAPEFEMDPEFFEDETEPDLEVSEDEAELEGELDVEPESEFVEEFVETESDFEFEAEPATESEFVETEPEVEDEAEGEPEEQPVLGWRFATAGGAPEQVRAPQVIFEPEPESEPEVEPEESREVFEDTFAQVEPEKTELAEKTFDEEDELEEAPVEDVTIDMTGEEELIQSEDDEELGARALLDTENWDEFEEDDLHDLDLSSTGIIEPIQVEEEEDEDKPSCIEPNYTYPEEFGFKTSVAIEEIDDVAVPVEIEDEKELEEDISVEAENEEKVEEPISVTDYDYVEIPEDSVDDADDDLAIASDVDMFVDGQLSAMKNAEEDSAAAVSESTGIEDETTFVFDDFDDDDLSDFLDTDPDEDVSVQVAVDTDEIVESFDNGEVKSFTGAFMPQMSEDDIAQVVEEAAQEVSDPFADRAGAVEYDEFMSSMVEIPDTVVAAEERLFAGLGRTANLEPVESEPVADAHAPAPVVIEEPAQIEEDVSYAFDDFDDLDDLLDTDDDDDDEISAPTFNIPTAVKSTVEKVVEPVVAEAGEIAEDTDDVIADLLSKMEARKAEFGEFVKKTRNQED